MNVVAPRVLGGRYQLTAEIAAGAVGRVFVADDLLLLRVVAVKVLRPEVADAGGGVAERFRREARAAAGLSHPNVAAVYDFGEDDGLPYLVMEWVPGDTLADVIRRGRMPLPEVLRIGAQIADGIGHAHDRGVVHRDLKPANVLLAPDGTAKVADFGIARLVGVPGVTMTGVVLGTPSYLAPEQALATEVGPAADLYALGAVLFEMLEGRPPFLDPDPMVVVAQHLHAAVPPVSGPPPVRRLVASLLAKSPDDRPSHAQVVARVLRAAAVPQTTAEAGSTTTAAVPVVAATSRLVPPRTATASPAPPPPPPETRARRRRLVVLGLVAVFCIAFLIAGFVLARAAFPTASRAPDFRGRTLIEARELAARRGLTVTLDIAEPSRDVPEGSVVRQAPAAGDRVAVGSTVHLVLSSGIPTVRVPQLVGLSEDQAAQALAAAGLRLGVVTVAPSVETSMGAIWRVDPPAGTILREGTAVNVTRVRDQKEWSVILKDFQS